MDIKNNTILITGGASGIGLQFTKSFMKIIIKLLYVEVILKN